jgi:hypothetical protein
LHSALSPPALPSIFGPAALLPSARAAALADSLLLCFASQQQTATPLISLSPLCLTSSSPTSLSALGASAATSDISSGNMSAFSSSLPASISPSGPYRPTDCVSISVLDPNCIRRIDGNESLSESDGETIRKRKNRQRHVVTDRMRRVKIIEAMNQLRVLLLEHGCVTSDQASIVKASAQLIQKLIKGRRGMESEISVIAAQLEHLKQQYASSIPQQAQ